jgi:hypothetical protein
MFIPNVVFERKVLTFVENGKGVMFPVSSKGTSSWKDPQNSVHKFVQALIESGLIILIS